MEDQADLTNSISQKDKLFITGLINLSFIFLGLSESIFGPTLMDLQDIYNTNAKTITIVLALQAIGSVTGSFIIGMLLDKYPKVRYCVLFGCTFIMGVSTGILPHLQFLGIFFAVSLVSSFVIGCLSAGGNVLCLDVWQGGDAGPYMHSIHFSISIGALLAPIVSMPFLGNNPNILKENKSNANSTIYEELVTETQITLLYPLVGLGIIICSLGFLIFAIKDNKPIKHQSEDDKGTPAELTMHQWAMIILMLFFFFFYGSVEFTFGIYLATFAVESNLHLTNQVGAQITAIFWGCFASMRFLSIFTAIYLTPIYMMGISCLISSIGTIVIAIYGDRYDYVLWTGSGLLGLGMASIFATGLLWLESYVKITNRIGAAMSTANLLGNQVFPIIGGQLIEQYPMTVMYLISIATLLCALIFVLAIFIGKKIKHDFRKSMFDNYTELVGNTYD